jgi:hypothetical protein
MLLVHLLRYYWSMCCNLNNRLLMGQVDCLARYLVPITMGRELAGITTICVDKTTIDKWNDKVSVLLGRANI